MVFIFPLLFSSICRSSERQALVGPPESMREHVVAASKAMRNGDWTKCRDLIINDKMNAKVRGMTENIAQPHPPLDLSSKSNPML